MDHFLFVWHSIRWRLFNWINFLPCSSVAYNSVKSFKQAEAQNPGFTYDLVNGILKKAEVDNRVDMTECLLKLEGTNNSTGMT